MESLMCAPVLLGLFLSRMSRTTVNAIGFCILAVVLAGMMWSRARRDRAPAHETVKLLVGMLAGAVPLIVLLCMVDWQQDVEEIGAAFFAVFAVHWLSDSTLDSVFAESRLKLRALGAQLDDRGRPAKRPAVCVPLPIVFAMGFFGLCWIHAGPGSARHALIPLTLAVAGLASLNALVVRRVSGMIRKGIPSQGAAPVSEPCMGTAATQGRALLLVLWWGVVLVCTGFLWVFSRQPALFSDPWPGLTVLYVVMLGLVSSFRKAGREMKILWKAAAALSPARPKREGQ